MSAGCHGLSWDCNSIVLVEKQTYHHPMRWVLGGTRQSILSFLPRQSCPPGFTLFSSPATTPLYLHQPIPIHPPLFLTVTVILWLIAHNSIKSWYIFVVLRNARIRHRVDFPSIVFISIIRVILIFLIIILICHRPQRKFLLTAASKINFIDCVNVSTLLHLIQLQASIFLLHTCNQLRVSLPPWSLRYLPSLLPQPCDSRWYHGFVNITNSCLQVLAVLVHFHGREIVIIPQLTCHGESSPTQCTTHHLMLRIN